MQDHILEKTSNNFSTLFLFYYSYFISIYSWEIQKLGSYLSWYFCDRDSKYFENSDRIEDLIFKKTANKDDIEKNNTNLFPFIWNESSLKNIHISKRIEPLLRVTKITLKLGIYKSLVKSCFPSNPSNFRNFRVTRFGPRRNFARSQISRADRRETFVRNQRQFAASTNYRPRIENRRI